MQSLSKIKLTLVGPSLTHQKPVLSEGSKSANKLNMSNENNVNLCSLREKKSFIYFFEILGLIVIESTLL